MTATPSPCSYLRATHLAEHTLSVAVRALLPWGRHLTKTLAHGAGLLGGRHKLGVLLGRGGGQGAVFAL